MRILLVEDDQALCDTVCLQLQNQGYTVDCCYDGEDSLHFIKEQVYDLIILDRMLPSLDGIHVLKAMRLLHITTPVLMVTALNSIGDKVTGLDAGADDYLAKPFAIEELLARIRALSRRPVDWMPSLQLAFGDTTFNLSALTLTGPKGTCSLSKKEAQLFEPFFKQPETPLPRTFLLSRVWGPSAEIEEGNLDNYMHFLRRRLRAVGSNIEIKTLRGVGYSLELCHA